MNDPSSTKHQKVRNAFELVSRDTRLGLVETQADADMYSDVAAVGLERVVAQLCSSGGRVDWRGWRGNIVKRNTAQREYVFAAHPAGSYPLYFRAASRGLVYSADPLKLTVTHQPDWVGCLEFLLFGYVLNGRSMHDDVQRLRPGEAVVLSEEFGRTSSRDTSALWKQCDPPDIESVLDTVWESLTSIMGRTDDCNQALLMSGGWDSRTLLAASNSAKRPILFGHGDTQSRELDIVRRLGRASGCEVQVREIVAGDYSVSALTKAFARTGNLLFPHWHRSGEELSALGVDFAYTGVFGEVFGGHYGASMAARGVRKALAVAEHLTKIHPRRMTQDDALRLLAPRAAQTKPWYVTREFWESDEWLNRIEADVQEDVARLRRRGVEDPERVVEAFISEHRGAQYIAQQPRSFLPHVGPVNPFTEMRILQAVSELPLEQRVHNSLNRLLLQRHAPHLLRVPTAAILVGAGRPVLVQEASRALRKAVGELRRRMGSPPQRTSWVNYDFLRGSGALHEVVSELRLDIWDKAAMRDRVAALDRGEEDPHPLSDMLMRVATVDRALAGAAAET